MASYPHENYALTNEDRALLGTLSVPIPSNEQKRIEILRQSKLADETSIESGFARFTSLATRLFDMPYAAVSFVEVDSISFQSKIGFEVESLSRNDWFDAYTILPESSEVYVIGDCSVDARFKEKPFVKNGPRIKFYAGAAIMIDDVKIGVLSIMDTEAHNYFGLEDKENLLDLGAAVAQLAKEKLQKTLNLSAERANIVVSMMHHLRTPMTSLNFATSLLCNDIQQIKVDASIDATPPAPMAVASGNNSNDPSLRPAHGTTSINSTASNNQATTAPPQPEMQQIPALFQSFESSFNEINMALNQLNILVDSSLSLGQAIIKCSNQDAISQLSATSPNPLSGMNSIPASVGGGMMGQGNSNDPRKNKFSECNLIEYLRDMFHHHLPIHNNNLDVEWIIETTDLCRGSHVTFPDAIMLIVISTVSHMSTESNSLGFYFNFQPADEEDFEYPELVNKMIEGKLSVKILAKDEKLPVNNNNNATDANNISSNNNTNAKHFNNFQAGNLLSTLSHDMDGAELLTKQNFLSIDKILRAINGSSKEYIEDISKFGLVEGNVKDLRTIHEFFIPCKILLNPNQVAQGNPHKLGTPKSSSLHHTQQQLQQQQQERQRVRLYRPPASNTYGLNDCGIKVTYENPLDEHLSDKDLVLTSLAMNEMKPTAGGGGGGGNENNLSINTQTPTAVNNQVAPPKQKVLRVLVVEDTIPVQKLLTRWLQNHGCEVTCANNGKIGLDYLTTQSFDIAFVDFLMPVMLGITTMKLYQEFVNAPTPETQALIDSSRELLIVGMSATALESEQEEAFNYGMHFFCPKPVSLELLSIVLSAKREYEINEEAVDRICSLISSNADEKVPPVAAPGAIPTTTTTAPVVQGATGGGAGSGNENHPQNSNNPIVVAHVPPPLGAGEKTASNSNLDGKTINTAAAAPIPHSVPSSIPVVSQELKDEKNKWVLFRKKKGTVYPEGGQPQSQQQPN